MAQKDNGWRLRLGPNARMRSDSMQWIVQRRKDANGVWYDIGYVCSKRDIVARVLRENGCEFDRAVLETLPEQFKDFAP